MHYLALVFRDDEGGYGFTVPDIPGFTAHAEETGLDAALAVARRVLADHLAAIVDAGLAVPEARAPEEVLADPEVQEDVGGSVAQMLLPAILPAGRTVRVNISIDENTLELADRAAADRNLTRSAFIAEAVRRFATGETDVEHVQPLIDRRSEIARVGYNVLAAADEAGRVHATVAGATAAVAAHHGFGATGRDSGTGQFAPAKGGGSLKRRRGADEKEAG